jgi:hypothetical protein
MDIPTDIQELIKDKPYLGNDIGLSESKIMIFTVTNKKTN